MTPTLYLEKTDSTNQYLINLIESDQVKEGLAVFCFNQTKGKGQKGNTWISEPGKNVCYSIFIKPDYIPVRNQFIISQVISLATKAFLEEFSGNISIKWPNDIYWNDKKIAGILIENKLKK
ncbi:MAG: biotin--[acetyl-CoA-carboxylase] ligase, partial [Bacteroidales bacterium]|nr:biotin--[acetyl-CoA-carboxylase] ligase [Bacteroidales bacterium]